MKTFGTPHIFSLWCSLAVPPVRLLPLLLEENARGTQMQLPGETNGVKNRENFS